MNKYVFTNIEKEKKILSKMIRIYCKGNHNTNKSGLCEECQSLYFYALTRLERCTLKNNKPTCKKCIIHCYSPAQKEKIRAIMRYSGPKMIFYHPFDAIIHIIKEVF